MTTLSTDLKTRNKAQADVKFACLKLKKQFCGAAKLENLSVEDWEAATKSWEKISGALGKHQVDAEVLRGYGVVEIVSQARTKVTEFVEGLESVVDGINADDAGRFQIREKMEKAKICRRNIDEVTATLEEVFGREKEVRKEWEEKNPRLAEQERELGIYSSTLRGLLIRKDSLNRLEKGEWIQAEGCLRSLETYLFEHKIEAQRIAETGFDGLMKELLNRFEDLDREGIDRKSVDVERVERVWGLVDKLGSGLMWLMRSDKLWKAGEPKPTTRSIFLLKSAPPAKMIFSASKEAWQEKELIRARDRIREILLDEDKPITADEENRWSAAYKELEALQTFLKKNDVQASSVKKAKLGATMRDIERRIGVLHDERGDSAEAGVGTFELMYVTWECAMRLGKQFEEMGDK